MPRAVPRRCRSSRWRDTAQTHTSISTASAMCRSHCLEQPRVRRVAQQHAPVGRLTMNYSVCGSERLSAKRLTEACLLCRGWQHEFCSGRGCPAFFDVSLPWFSMYNACLERSLQTCIWQSSSRTAVCGLSLGSSWALEACRSLRSCYDLGCRQRVMKPSSRGYPFSNSTDVFLGTARMLRPVPSGSIQILCSQSSQVPYKLWITSVLGRLSSPLSQYPPPLPGRRPLQRG